MNQIVSRPSGKLPVITPQPTRLSPGLESAIRAVSEPHPDLGPQIETLNAEANSEARSALADLERLCAPASDAQIVEWLRPINAAVRNPVSAADFAIRVSVIAFALADVPAGAFSVQTQRWALSSWKFWPAAADVLELLRGPAQSLEHRRDSLRRLLNGQPRSQPARPDPTEAEREYVRQTVANLTAELRDQAARNAARTSPLRAKLQPRGDA